MKQVFLDTSLLIALYVASDAMHLRALRQLSSLEQAGTQFVTTDAVLTEFCNSLAKVALRRRAAAAVQGLMGREDVIVIRIAETLWHKAFAFYQARSDKDWGLTDCISFEVMKERRIKAALTADHHFAQAGFTALLKK